MRFLYGDLTEFPQQENVLETFQRFFDMATAVLALDYEVGGKLAAIEEDRAWVGEVLDEVGAFSAKVEEAVRAAAADRPADDVVAVVAEGLLANQAQFIDEARRRVVARVEARIRDTQIEIGKLRRDIFGHLKAFFAQSGLPLQRHSLVVESDGAGYGARAEVVDLVGFECRYLQNTAASTFFCATRRFGDLVPGKNEFPVGTRRGWLKREPVPEKIRLDDAVITRIEDGEVGTRAQLVRKAGEDGLLLTLARSQPPALGCFRLSPAGESIPIPDELIGPAERELAAQFFSQLGPHLVELYRLRGELQELRLEGRDVIAERMLGEVVLRLVRFWTPTIREIDRRSTSDAEWNLKVEHEGGRREEIYIQKRPLADRLRSLPKALQALFDPLGLEAHRTPAPRPLEKPLDGETTDKVKNPLPGPDRGEGRG